MTLLELTGQESGIMVYGTEVFVCNWASCGDDCLPKLFIGGYVDYPVDDGAIENMQSTKRTAKRITDALPEQDECEVGYDYNEDMARIYSGELDGECEVYELPDGGILIAPAGWN